ncbi:MAG TPA: hypothetical protein VFC78_04365 [Tepidisphaeraceae bacterium]|nr:hypothetical protein [Tepidisphaeraceae bacterium]
MYPSKAKQIAFLAPLLLLAPLLAAAAPAYEPTASYDKQSIEGWTIYVSHDLMASHTELRDKSLALLRVKFFDITRVVPAPALAKLREVPLWLEYRDRGFPCMCYHPSRQWLTHNGYNPEKARGVEIANAENFLKWSLEQPWMILHEYAHSYHDRVLGFDNAEVKAAYQAMVDSHTYDHVLHINGSTVRHYALTDPQEYFAESSEAFFGTNDFYPFVRAELQQHDPRMYKLLWKVWGMPGKIRNPKHEIRNEAEKRKEGNS